MTMTHSAPPTRPLDVDPARWRALWVCLAVGFMTMLDVSIVNVALPSIESQLNAGPAQLQLIVAGYTLAFGLVLVPAGRLGDMWGRRSLFIIGLIGFALTSLASGMAPNDETLALFRLLQGASAGILNPQVIGLIQQMFTGAERGRAFGFFGAIIGISTAIGPLAGGLIIQLAGVEVGWRWIFFINVPIAAIIIPMAFKWLPAPPPRTDRKVVLDAVGLLLIAATTTSVMLPFVLTSGDEGDNPARWWFLALAGVFAVVTVLWERRFQSRTGEAVIDSSIVSVASFRNGTLLGMAYFAGFTSIFLIVTLYLQGPLGMSALAAGLVMMPFAVTSALSSWVSGRFVARYGRQLVVWGLVMVLVGIVATDVVIRTASETDSPTMIGVRMGVVIMIAGLGSGIVISPNQTLTLAEVPVARAGVGGSMLQVGQRVGSALGVSVAVSIFFSQLALGSSGATATSRALMVAIILVAVALVIGIFDARYRHKVDDPSGAGTVR